MRKWFWIIGFIFLISIVSYFARPYLLILSGYGAKNMCSCVYIQGRDPQSVKDNELGHFPLTLGSFSVNLEDSSATGSVYGLAKRTAVFRKGEGCTLLVDYPEDEFKKRPPMPLTLSGNPADSLDWPYGSKDNETFPEHINYVKLKETVDSAFMEKENEVKLNTRGIVIVYKDQLVIERYADGFSKDTPQMGWSMSKSITNALVGILVKEGKLAIDAPAPVEQWSDTGDPRHAITLNQLMRMISGIKWEENYAKPSSATRMLFTSHDMGGYTASLPLEADPGEYWEYSSGTTNLLSKIIRETTGEDYLSFVDRELFSKLGITTVVWERDESGTLVGSSFMWASPRAWAKLGLLYLHDGVWNGERILPEGWVKYSATQTAPAVRGYGAQFWLNVPVNGGKAYPDAPDDMICMEGFEDQRVFIIPSRQMVVVRLGQTADEHFPFNEFLRGVLESIQE